MKRFLYVLLTVLMALPMVAQAQEVTSNPVIQIEENQDELTIIVTGDGMLSVKVMRDQDNDFEFVIPVDEAQVEETYVFTIQRSYDENEHFHGQVTATAQEDGKLPSETVEKRFTMRPYYVMPRPEITFTEDDGGVTITVDKIVAQLDITISVNGECVIAEQQIGYGAYTYYIEKSSSEKLIEVHAINQGTTHGDIWQESTSTYLLAALEQSVAKTPWIEVNQTDDYAIVTAQSDEEGSTVHLLLNGEEVSNPYVALRMDFEQELEFMAYSVVDGKLQSDYYFQLVYLPAYPPIEATSAPTISIEDIDLPDGVISKRIIITPTEPSVIYYTCYAIDETGDYIVISDVCQEGEVEFVIQDPGHYRVSAFAIADGKDPSAVDQCEFMIYAPWPKWYDFEEDGIFYKKNGETVSVCFETTDHHTYSGEVNIPATVTHDGVTYMVTAIDEDAFRDCSEWTSVTIGAYVTDIAVHAFYGCTSLTSVTLGDYVISLGYEAFAGCNSLTTVNLGSGLAQIGDNAFLGCSELTDVRCKAATPPVMTSSNCFNSNVYATATLHVFPAVLDKYQSANGWSQFANIVPEDNAAPATGDANGDGKLSIDDISTLINMLLMGE